MSAYRALREAAAWLDISSRGRIRASGDDRVRFLHAMSSNDIESLDAGAGADAFFLNAQGQIQADAHLYVAADHVLLDTEPEFREPLIRHLENFIIMDDVALEDQTASSTAVALEGPKSEDIARQAFAVALPAGPSHAHCETDGIRLSRTSITGQPALWVLSEVSRKQELVERLERAGAVAASAADFQVVRVENHVPRLGEDFFDSNIPHETQLMQAVSFTKGCYLGQEIVERVRSRGRTNKLLVSLELEGEAPPPGGTAVEFEGKQAGRLTSPVFSPGRQRVVGFAILRREAAAEGTPVQVHGMAGRVGPLSASLMEQSGASPMSTT